MPLEMQDRELGKVAVIECLGRIVAGTEAQAIEARVNKLCAGCSDLVLDLGGVTFIDSSGLGTLVRLLSRVRRSGGDLKLCQLSAAVRQLLQLTNLLQVFDVQESQASAVSAFYTRSRLPAEKAGDYCSRVLCIHPSADTLVYLRELLRRSGYDAVTSSNLPDAVVLLKATAPTLVILAGEMQSPRNRAAADILRETRADVPLILLEQDFSRQDAGQAGSALLAAVRSHLGDPGAAQ